MNDEKINHRQSILSVSYISIAFLFLTGSYNVFFTFLIIVLPYDSPFSVAINYLAYSFGALLAPRDDVDEKSVDEQNSIDTQNKIGQVQPQSSNDIQLEQIQPKLSIDIQLEQIESNEIQLEQIQPEQVHPEQLESNDKLSQQISTSWFSWRRIAFGLSSLAYPLWIGTVAFIKQYLTANDVIIKMNEPIPVSLQIFLIIISIYNGFSYGILWASQGAWIAEVVRTNKKQSGLLNGIFFTIYELSGFIGNIIITIILRNISNQITADNEYIPVIIWSLCFSSLIGSLMIVFTPKQWLHREKRIKRKLDFTQSSSTSLFQKFTSTIKNRFVFLYKLIQKPKQENDFTFFYYIPILISLGFCNIITWVCIPNLAYTVGLDGLVYSYLFLSLGSTLISLILGKFWFDKKNEVELLEQKFSEKNEPSQNKTDIVIIVSNLSLVIIYASLLYFQQYLNYTIGFSSSTAIPIILSLYVMLLGTNIATLGYTLYVAYARDNTLNIKKVAPHVYSAHTAIYCLFSAFSSILIKMISYNMIIILGITISIISIVSIIKLRKYQSVNKL